MKTTIFWLLVMSLLLEGCGIGGHWMEGSPYTSPVEPYIELWEKPGMTNEGRWRDWLACGGFENGNHGFDTEDYRLPGDTYEEARQRGKFKFQSCIANKGYFYTENCSGKRATTEPICEFSP